MLIGNEQFVINSLKKSLEELRSITDKYERDLYSTHRDLEHTAILISREFLIVAFEFFKDQIQKKANCSYIKKVYPEFRYTDPEFIYPTNEKDVVDFLKKSFEKVRNVTDKLERDIYSSDKRVQHTAIYLLGQFLSDAHKFFAGIKRHIDNCRLTEFGKTIKKEKINVNWKSKICNKFFKKKPYSFCLVLMNLFLITYVTLIILGRYMKLFNT